jgi:hypothetical protein
VTTRDIRPSTAHTICDVCGRTLLRGERAEAYLHGGARRWVCELCKSRALHEGWMREGTVPTYDQDNARSERRRSLLGRLRARREAWADGQREQSNGDDAVTAPPPPAPDPPTPVPRRRQRAYEQRQVRAVPTSPEQKTVEAIELFNSSEHTRTVSGVARSLGLPTVSVSPAATPPGQVNLVVSWELCWYRYEVDLSDEVPTVRVGGQGYELEELDSAERTPNAVADDRGSLSLTR